MKEKQNEPLIAKINDLVRIIKLRDIELKKAFDRISELQNLLNEYKDSEHAAIKAEGEALRKVAELEQDKQNVREWTRKHRALISYVAETHSIPAFMLEELNDE
jgi:DNA repair ATPase RecN